MKTIVLLFLVAFSFSACLKDEPFKLVYTDSVPESLDDGWVTGTPAAVGMDEAIIDEVYQSFFSAVWLVLLPFLSHFLLSS